MAKQGASKGNPASHRMSNPHHKDKHQKAWKHSQERKEARRLAQTEREKANRMLRAEGKPTAWEAAQAKRQAVRGAAKPPMQPRVAGTGNIIKPDGRIVACCQAKTRITDRRRVKCPHLGFSWVDFAGSPQGRDLYRGGA